ncbi:glycosyltransferase family 2 protein [Metaclostridioides mangenotii]|uniref:glycosyltransferase family 2 protein n=1 Tax=Metaclostridioides mangenotii TaxID=1540 RepID=UPI0026F0E39E|nr:glycosyltransferase [Clostridioides mangenotii]
MSDLKKVLIGSPIHQTPDILKEFLISLKELNKSDFDISYYFIDDNIEEISSDYLKNFKESEKNVTLIASNFQDNYVKNEHTHMWSSNLVDKVANFKNEIIRYSIENNFDYLFFIDSDLIVNPRTLNQLVGDNKDIISNVFWTKWEPNTIEMPQVWLMDSYDMHDDSIPTDHAQQTMEFINKMRIPGVYKVGGLGACTLISKKALLAGVSFSKIYNLSFWGEDRHFCIRAASLGLELYVDTHLPAYHIYRYADLDGVENYKKDTIAKNKDLIKFKVLNNITKGINALETYSYQTEFSNEFLVYFTSNEGSKQLALINSKKDNVKSNKIINRASITKCDFDFNINDTKIDCDLELTVDGFKNFKSYYNKYSARCRLEKQNDGNYLIDEFIIENEITLDNAPIVRYFREKPTLTLSMIVKNEEGRYLKKALESAREYIDNAVIIDDASTDNTIEICKEALKGIPLTLILNKESKFSNEIDLRKQQWRETISTDPDWILFLDADEIFEDKFKDNVKELMINYDIDSYMFRLYDFWNEDHYRDDNLWRAHNSYRVFMIRYQKNFDYKFNETAQHCGRMPYNVGELQYCLSNMRLKHYGWSCEEDRIEKYNRYLKLDPNGEFGSLDQYASILDENINLTKWDENS